MKNICNFILLILLIGCTNKNTSTRTDLVVKINQSMDGVETIPEWLQLEVGNTLPSDSLNIWIPTGNIKTSTMIRVPRFPTELIKENLEKTPFDLSRYKIKLLENDVVSKITGVKNEQISVQLAIAAKQNISNLNVKISDFISSTGEKISKSNIKIRYVKYVPVQRARSELSWTGKPEEIYGPEVSGYGAPDVVADPLLELAYVDVPAYRAQPVWLTFSIPKNAKPSIYKGNISIQTNEFKKRIIPIEIEVLDTEIPDPKDYKFFLDLWLNPKAIAVANHLEIWSEKHWELIESYMEDLVSRGAKTITTTITHDPWKIEWVNGTKHSQTGIGYSPMIQWNRSKDDTWSYDYSVFDRYVTLALKIGLTERIDVFSLTPFEWGGKRYVTYFDEDKGEIIEQPYGQFDSEYKEHWKRFL